MDRVGPTIVGHRSTPGVGAARELLRRNEVFPDGTQLESPEEYTELVSGGGLPSSEYGFDPVARFH